MKATVSPALAAAARKRDREERKRALRVKPFNGCRRPPFASPHDAIAILKHGDKANLCAACGAWHVERADGTDA